MTVMDLDKLEIWAKAFEYATTIYKEVIPCLPPEEKWNLSQQLRRAAQSIPANIAEGHGRYHYLDTVRFCYMARGSLTEVESHLALACNLGYISTDLYHQVSLRGEALCKKMNTYIGYLKRMKRGDKEFPTSYHIREDFPDYY